MAKRATAIAISVCAACGGAATDAPVITVPMLASSSPPIVATPRAAPEPPSSLADGAHFHVSIEQDGREIAADDERVAIDLRPFVVVVRFAAPGAIMLNASVSGRTFLLAAGGGNHADLDEVVGQGHGMAEDNPPDRLLMLANDGAHYLFFTDDRAHRCHDVRREGSVIVCRRVVDKLMFVPTHRTVDVATSRADSLYLVAVMFDPGKPEVELQRERLRIVFRP